MSGVFLARLGSTCDFLRRLLCPSCHRFDLVPSKKNVEPLHFQVHEASTQTTELYVSEETLHYRIPVQKRVIEKMSNFCTPSTLWVEQKILSVVVRNYQVIHVG